MYNRTRSVKCPPFKFVNVTALQLIASGLVRMEIDKNHNCQLRLVINEFSPSYLDRRIWADLYTVNEGNENGDGPTISTEDNSFKYTDID